MDSLTLKLDYNQTMVDASNRLHAIINACINKDDDSIICNICSSMYSSEKDIPAVKKKKKKKKKEKKNILFLTQIYASVTEVIGLNLHLVTTSHVKTR